MRRRETERRSSWQGEDEHRGRRVWVFIREGVWVPARIDHAGRRLFETPRHDMPAQPR